MQVGDEVSLFLTCNSVMALMSPNPGKVEKDCYWKIIT